MPSRRAFLAGGAAAALSAAASARAGDPRIVSMDLVFTEMLLALGVAPVAIANVPLYRRLVGTPAAPAGAADLGPLTEPNLELLQYLAPDLILAASWQASALQPLERIARVVWLPSFARGQSPLAFTGDLLARIASLARREAEATALRSAADAALARAAKRLRAVAGRPVYLLRFAEDGRRTAIFGAASMVGDVLARTGLSNAFIGRSNVWGTASVGIERLIEVPEAGIVHFERGDETLRAMKRLNESPIWHALPAVRGGRVFGMPVVHPNGGLVSAMRFADQLVAVLGAAGPERD